MLRQVVLRLVLPDQWGPIRPVSQSVSQCLTCSGSICMFVSAPAECNKRAEELSATIVRHRVCTRQAHDCKHGLEPPVEPPTSLGLALADALLSSVAPVLLLVLEVLF